MNTFTVLTQAHESFVKTQLSKVNACKYNTQLYKSTYVLELVWGSVLVWVLALVSV